MAQKQKIAIFTDSFLPGVGGTENAVLYYAQELSKKYIVKVYAPYYHGKNNKEVFSFDVVRIKSIKMTGNDFLVVPSLDKNFKSSIAEFSPDVIHTMTIGPLADYAIKYAHKNNIPIVSTVHTKYLFCYERALHLKLLAKIVVKNFSKYLNYSNVICTVSSDMANELKTYGILKDAVVIKNGLIKRNSNFEKSENAVFNCLFVGYVIKYKNIEFTLDVLKIVKEKGYNFVFNIVGDGPDKNYFEKLVEKYDLKNQVNFYGRITDYKALDKIYAQSDLVLFPSVFDNDPLVVGEAGNMGTPSLVIEKTGASERITDGINGFTAKNNIKDYAKKLMYLMDNRQLLKDVGKNAHTIVYSWEENVQKYGEIYDTVIKDRQTKTIDIIKKENKNGNLRRISKAWTNRTSN